MELANLLSLKTAVPYLRLFRNQLLVVKVGGEAVADESRLRQLVEQLNVLHQLGIGLVIVHGGGPQATALGEQLGVESHFVAGRRVTSPAMVEAMVMALNGTVRTKILAACRAQHLNVLGVSGIDAGIVKATQRPPRKLPTGETVDFGQVGDIASLDVSPLRMMVEQGFVPVVSSLAADDAGTVLNINADDVASAIAVALGASKLILITKPRGIMGDVDKPETLMSEITIAELEALEAKGVVHAGMLPKSGAAKSALTGGVERVHVISYEYPDSVLAELFTNEGCGTMVTP